MLFKIECRKVNTSLTNERHHLANQVIADLLLYLFSSVSSPRSIVELLGSKGAVIIEEDVAKAASLLKLLRFVVTGLKKQKTKIQVNLF